MKSIVNDTVLISIIVPTYNRVDYLKACLDSITKQSFKDYEVIVVDDGSEDASLDLLKQLQATNHNIRILFQPHQGVSSARNLGLSRAKGKYIAFVDSDDTLANNYFQTIVDVTLEDYYDLIIFGIQNIIHHITTVSYGEAWTISDHLYMSSSEFADQYIRSGKMLMYSNCNKIYRKSLIQKHQLLFQEDLHYGEDRLFNWDYLKHTNKIRTLDVLLYKYHHQQISSLSKSLSLHRFQVVELLHVKKIQTMFNLKEKTSQQEWEYFAYMDLKYELHTALSEIISNFQHSTSLENKRKINAIVAINYPSYYRTYAKQETMRKQFFSLLMLSKSDILIQAYCRLVLLRRNLRHATT